MTATSSGRTVFTINKELAALEPLEALSDPLEPELPQDPTEFGQVDLSSDPQSFIRLTDALNRGLRFIKLKQRTFEALRLETGWRVLDVGCGTGDDARALAELVGPSGLVVGIDNSRAMIKEAERRALGLGLPLDFRVDDAMHLNLEDDSFNACRCERVLMHLDEPQAAMSELVRVTRPGGRVVAMDVDWDAVVVDHPDKVLTRQMIGLLSDRIRNGQIGRRLPRLFLEAGLRAVEVAPHTLFCPFPIFALTVGVPLRWAQQEGNSVADDFEQWWRTLSDQHQAGRFFAAINCFIVTGVKEPESPVIIG